MKNLLILFSIVLLIWSCGEAEEPISFRLENEYEVAYEIETLGDAKHVYVNDSLMLIAQGRGGFSVWDTKNISSTKPSLIKNVGGDLFRYVNNRITLVRDTLAFLVYNPQTQEYDVFSEKGETFVVASAQTFGLEAVPLDACCLNDTTTIEFTESDYNSSRIEFSAGPTGFPKPIIYDVFTKTMTKTFSDSLIFPPELFTYAFIAAGEKGVIIRDFNLINNAVSKIWEIQLSGHTEGIRLVGDSLIYCVNEEAGFQIVSAVLDYDSTSSEHNFRTNVYGGVDTDGAATKLVVANEGKYAYIADGNSGVAIIRVDNINTPQLVKSILTGDTAQDIAIDEANNKIFVANDNEGLFIYDILDRENPVLTDRFQFGPLGNEYKVVSVTFHKGLVFAAVGNGGVKILRRK